MPFKNTSGGFEHARSLGHVPLVNSPFIQEKLKSYNIYDGNTTTPIDQNLLVHASALSAPETRPSHILAFDGSSQEVAARESYPSTRIGYAQIAGVLVHLDRMLDQGGLPLVDPAVIRNSARESLIPIVMPSSNVCLNGVGTVRDSWRKEIYDIFATYSVENVSLLDSYFLLIAYSNKKSGANAVVLPRCAASNDCDEKNIPVPKTGGICPKCKGHLFSTDALRIHEEVGAYTPNETALNRLMSVLEHIVMVSYLNYFYYRKPQILGSIAFVMDGPLAVFGPQAWLHGPIAAYVSYVYNDLTQKNLRLPIILGIEKTGNFAEHVQSITNHIERRTLMRLPDTYIYGRILAARETMNVPYGDEFAYGRKFFYKTAQNQLLTVSIPSLQYNSVKAKNADDPNLYPTLSNTLSLLDQIGTSLYQNAIIPVALAHSYASIPLHTGTQVLTLLSQQGLNL